MNKIYIKQIIPNLFIGSNIDIFDENFIKYNIKNIININNIIDSDNNDNNTYNITNLSINDNQLLIKSNNLINIDFNSVNNFIENSYINKEDVLINSNDIMLSALFPIAFIVKKLNITIIDAIYYVYKFINIDLKFIPEYYINTLFVYYNSL
jgi:hypothetical protein